jgi:hypothetical protein
MNPRAGLDAVEMRENFCSCQEPNTVMEKDSVQSFLILNQVVYTINSVL